MKQKISIKDKIQEEIWELICKYFKHYYIPPMQQKKFQKELKNLLKKRDLKIIEKMMDTYKEVSNFEKTKIPRCPICYKDFVKIGEESTKYHQIWEPSCDCLKNRDLKLSIG